MVRSDSNNPQSAPQKATLIGVRRALESSPTLPAQVSEPPSLAAENARLARELECVVELFDKTSIERDALARERDELREKLAEAVRELDSYRAFRDRTPSSLPPPSLGSSRQRRVISGSYSFSGGEERVDVVATKRPPPRSR